MARSYEEGDVCKDSPTMGKSTMRLLLTIAASKGRIVKTTDIKSALLQGKVLDRDVYAGINLTGYHPLPGIPGLLGYCL